MASSILGIAKKLRSLTANTTLASLRRSLSTESSERTRRRTKNPSKLNLYERVVPLGRLSNSIAPVLNQWDEEGKTISSLKLRIIIESLRKRKRYGHALEVCEWMSKKGLGPLSSSDRAICLDLIGKVRGVKSAESYFSSLSDVKENSKVYGALLNCYVGQSMVEKSLSHMRKMKDMGFANAFNYNAIIGLYKNTNQLDKIPDVLAGMKKAGFVPDSYSYRLCINAYGLRSDLESLEMVLKEMEAQPNTVQEWNTYSMAAGFFVKAGDLEKAMTYLKKCEELVGKDALGYNFLISQHAKLGNKDEIMRLWVLQKAFCEKLVDKDYVTMLSSLGKIGEFEDAEKILEEWVSSCSYFDFRVPNVLLMRYCQRGFTEKAESMLRNMVVKGKTPIPNSWSIIAIGYLDGQNMDKAFECVKEAFAVRTNDVEWKPKTRVIMETLDWLVDSGDVEEVEAFVSLVKNVVSVDKEMYRALIRAYVKAGKEVSGVLESMKSDGIVLDEETEKS